MGKVERSVFVLRDDVCAGVRGKNVQTGSVFKSAHAEQRPTCPSVSVGVRARRPCAGPAKNALVAVIASYRSVGRSVDLSDASATVVGCRLWGPWKLSRPDFPNVVQVWPTLSRSLSIGLDFGLIWLTLRLNLANVRGKFLGTHREPVLYIALVDIHSGMGPDYWEMSRHARLRRRQAARYSDMCRIVTLNLVFAAESSGVWRSHLRTSAGPCPRTVPVSDV